MVEETKENRNEIILDSPFDKEARDNIRNNLQNEENVKIIFSNMREFVHADIRRFDSLMYQFRKDPDAQGFVKFARTAGLEHSLMFDLLEALFLNQVEQTTQLKEVFYSLRNLTPNEDSNGKLEEINQKFIAHDKLLESYSDNRNFLEWLKKRQNDEINEANKFGK